MKKSLRNGFIYALSTLLLFSCVLLLYFGGAFTSAAIPTAKADGTLTLKNDIKDGNFSWTNGAALKLEDFAQGKYTLGFQLNLENPKHQDLLTYEAEKTVSNMWNTFLKESSFTYGITIMQDNGESAKPEPLARLIYIYDYLRNTNGEVVLAQTILRENIAVYSEAIETPLKYTENLKTDFSAIYPNEKDVSIEKRKEDLAAYYSQDLNSQVECLSYGYYEDKGGLFYPGAQQTATVFSIGVNSPYQSYFCRFEYNYNLQTKRNMFGSNFFKKSGGAIDSDTRCVSTVIKNMRDEGYLNGGDAGVQELFEINFAGNENSIALAYELLKDNVQTVKIKYLKDIEGTPFATPVFENVKVPVVSGGVYLDDVIAYKKSIDEKFEGFKALDSVAYRIVLDEDNCYTVNYLKNVVVQTILVDGEYCESYLDVNKSYVDYYQPLIKSDKLSESTFEYVYSKSILTKYPQLSGYTMDEIYGYFGFVAAPEAVTFESLMSNMFFDYEKSIVGLVEGHYYKKDILFEDYYVIMSDFGYNYSEIAWAGVFELKWNVLNINSEAFTTNFYVFYCLPGTSKAVIAEGGQTSIDDGSVMDIEVKKITKGIGAGVLAVGNDVANYSYYITYGILIAGALFLMYKFGPALGFSFGGSSRSRKSNKKSSSKKSNVRKSSSKAKSKKSKK